MSRGASLQASTALTIPLAKRIVQTLSTLGWDWIVSAQRGAGSFQGKGRQCGPPTSLRKSEMWGGFYVKAPVF